MSDVDPEILCVFVEDTQRDVRMLYTLLTQYKNGDTAQQSEIVMKMHSIKGNSRYVSNAEIENAAHECETIFQSGLDDEAFDAIAARLEVIQNELSAYGDEQSSQADAMQPIEKSWERLPQILEALQNELSKSIALNCQDGDIIVPRHIAEGLRNPLMHLVTNAATHGIENSGEIEIKARQDGEVLEIIVQDNGRGLDVEKIKHAAVDSGIDINGLSAEDIFQLIFTQGFSTLDKADNTAGRGIGLFAVRQDLAKIGGTIHAASPPNQGTRFTIRIFISDF